MFLLCYNNYVYSTDYSTCDMSMKCYALGILLFVLFIIN